MKDDEFFSAMAERFVEKTVDKAVEKRLGKAPEKGHGLNAALVIGPAAANAFDAYATREMLKSGKGKEANPVMAPFADNAFALYGTKVGTGLLIGFFANKVSKAGHPTAAKVISGVSIALPVGAGINNLQIARKK